MHNRHHILDTARQLFNDHGTGSINLEAIAQQAAVSRQALQWHFRTKAEIIRAIFDQLASGVLEQTEEILRQHPPGSRTAIEQIFSTVQSFHWRYRFLNREQSALSYSDYELKQRFHQYNRRQREALKQAIARACDTGTLRPLDQASQLRLTDKVWLLTLFWLNYLEIGGAEVNDQSLNHGDALLRQMLNNYGHPARR